MLSLYIHIPFCHYKCGYCSFNVIPLEVTNNKLESTSNDKDGKLETGSLKPIISTYLDALHRQIDEFATLLSEGDTKQELRTIYFGGGTPSTIGSAEMIRLIDHITDVRDLTYLEELSIEINPEPEEQMIELIQTISKYYKHFPRVRFNIGIQSFDNEVLEQSHRQYNFQACVQFLRKLTQIKMDHNVFNFDFIAFGKFNQTRKGDLQLRDPVRLDFFEQFVHSGFADSFSLYTLELFEGSDRYNQQILDHNHEKAGYGLKKYGSDDDVYAEFELLKSILLDAGYQRYEISNYSKAGANSIHNRVYRAMGERLGLGTGATSHLKRESLEHILENSKFKIQNSKFYSGHISIVPDLKRFVARDWIDDKKTELLTEDEYLKEKFLMGMRTMDGVQLCDHHDSIEIQIQRGKDKKEQPSYLHTQPSTSNTITDILVDDRAKKISLFAEQGFCIYHDGRLRLTDTGMDVYNTIITDLMV